MLCEFYNHINETMPTALEIVFISSDRDSNGFDLYFGQMPWVAVPYESMKSLNSLSARYVRLRYDYLHFDKATFN